MDQNQIDVIVEGLHEGLQAGCVAANARAVKGAKIGREGARIELRTSLRHDRDPRSKPFDVKIESASTCGYEVFTLSVTIAARNGCLMAATIDGDAIPSVAAVVAGLLGTALALHRGN
jgi:hypothetical protein